MYYIKFIYNNYCRDEAKDIINRLDIPENTSIKEFNEDATGQYKKAWMLKFKASARMIPFVTIYKDKKLIKSFYTEVSEVTVDNIQTYINKNLK